MANILFTICGRAGSKGLKSKNVKKFDGYPLPYFTLSAIDLVMKNSPHQIDIALNTDSPELKDLFKPFPQVIMVARKPELATDSAGKIGVIKDSYQYCISHKGDHYDYVIDLDITSPLRTVTDIENLISHYEQNKQFEVVFSVVRSRRNPYFNMVKVNADNSVQLVEQSEFTARQQAPIIYDMNASMYLYTPHFLRSKNSIFDGVCGTIEMRDYHILDIDSEDDFKWMEFIFPKIKDENPDINKIYTNIQSLLDNSKL